MEYKQTILIVRVKRNTTHKHQNSYFLDGKGNERKATQKEARDQSVQ
jgi:hypothetical protein